MKLIVFLSSKRTDQRVLSLLLKHFEQLRHCAVVSHVSSEWLGNVENNFPHSIAQSPQSHPTAHVEFTKFILRSYWLLVVKSPNKRFCCFPFNCRKLLLLFRENIFYSRLNGFLVTLRDFSAVSSSQSVNYLIQWSLK